MFILLDTGYLSSFENDALKIPVREKINPKTQWASEHITSWEMSAPPPHLMGFFISVELCNANFDLALWLSRVPKWSVCTHTYKFSKFSSTDNWKPCRNFYETEIIAIARLKIIHMQGLLKKWIKALNCFVTAASIFILLSEQKRIINMLLSKK